ncbi:tape measure protein, partial [Endothiovibrio diazotrophicus]
IVPEADRARLAVYQQVEAVDHVGDAFRRMGIQSRDELERTVDEARRDFYTIRDSGVASYSQIQAAARQYAATLRAANNGVLPPAEQARLAIWRIGEAAEEAGRKGQEGLGHVRAGAADLGAAVQTIASAFVLQEIVDANKHAEAWAKSMEQVVGSSEAAAAEIAYVRSEANRLGLDVRAAADSYTLLAASAKGTALTGADVRKVWSAVSESMARLGKSSADTEGALLALGQMASKGTVQAEELRGQLGERLPGAMQTAAKAMGVTTAQLGKMMEQGELAASDFLPRFADALEESFGRGEAAIDTFAAKQARLMNGFRELSLLASETGLFDGAAGGLEAIGDLVKHVAVGTKTATAYMGELGSEIGLAVARFTERDFAGFTDDILAARAEMDKSIAEYADRVYGVVPAAHAAGDAVVATATEARTAYSELSKELQKVVDGIDKAGDATKAFGKLDLGNIDGVAAVEELNNLITAMGEKAELSGEQIEKELGAALDKLSGEQLQSLQFEAEAAFGEIEGGAENLELILRASLGASLKQLGVDAKELETGMDAATRVAVDGFRAVADNAQASGEAVRRSFDNALGQVTNVRGVEELGKALRSAFEEGKLSASEYEARVALLERRHQALAATVDRDLAAAFQRMGIKSRAELKAVADQAEADYQRIKASGQASADGLAQAAERWKTAAEAAGDRAAAAQAKVSEELHRSAASAESMEGRTTAALHQVAEAAEDTGDALSRIQDALQSATTISEIQAVEEELRRLRTEGKLTAEELASGMEAVDQRAAAVSNTMASIALGTDAMFRNLSTSLANAYYEVEGVDGELAQLAERARLAADSFYIPDSSISSWAELMRHQRSLITQFAEQAEGAAQLQAQLQGVEGANERLVVQARRTVQTFDLLDQTQLDGITREIERVAAASDRLKDSITSTVSRLQDELDRLEGDQAAIERRNYEQEKRALQQQLDEAQRGLNRDVAQEAEKALGLLERVHAARKAEIDTQADPAPTPATARTVTPPPTTPPAAQPTQATSGGLRTIRLEAGGFDVDVLTDGDIEAFGHRLVQVIEQAGLRVV